MNKNNDEFLYFDEELNINEDTDTNNVNTSEKEPNLGEIIFNEMKDDLFDEKEDNKNVINIKNETKNKNINNNSNKKEEKTEVDEISGFVIIESNDNASKEWETLGI